MESNGSIIQHEGFGPRISECDLSVREILGEAAEAFAKSHHTAKQRQVLSLLESVNEQHSLSRRIATMSQTVSRMSPIVAFLTRAGGEESPVGHSRFTGPHIDADYSLSTPPADQRAGEVSIELRVANIGSHVIQIVLIDNFVPETALVTRVSPNAKVARGSIIPIRKNTPPMDVESFQFTIAAGKGPVIVKPNIVYVDENG